MAILFLLVAALYASVGQAGATGYLAIMGLAGFAPATMKVTALALNIVVAAIGLLQQWRAGRFSWRCFYPFGVLGFPFSLLGGAIHLASRFYYPVVGTLLLLAAVQLIRSARDHTSAPGVEHTNDPPFLPALVTGAAIGFVSGVTGTGGGIFLAPVLLMMNWVEVRRAAAVSAAYNLINSLAALLGAYRTNAYLPVGLPWWIAAVSIGGFVGSTLGSRYLSERTLRRILALILACSAVKLILL